MTLMDGQGVACHVTARMGFCDVRIASEASWNARCVVLHAMNVFPSTQLRCIVLLLLDCSSMNSLILHRDGQGITLRRFLLGQWVCV